MCACVLVLRWRAALSRDRVVCSSTIFSACLPLAPLAEFSVNLIFASVLTPLLLATRYLRRKYPHLIPLLSSGQEGLEIGEHSCTSDVVCKRAACFATPSGFVPTYFPRVCLQHDPHTHLPP